ncbi:MAG: quinone-dependent dihydroorotate dehydrogenase [Verrucomicrobiae bacterium]|nr:quinone-dependent dihydroorotate dehydrogenase [Verrucomicrobiae bacterium]
MSWIYRSVVRPCLFRQESEGIHDRTLRLLGMVARSGLARGLLRAVHGAPGLPVDVFGLSFPNPVGLAAGMDKSAQAVPVWECLGFGHCELGGVTRHGQPGNERPRMFRVVPDEALINRMGFNNPGADALAARLGGWRDGGRWPRHPVGINLGKSKITPLEEAAADYRYSFERLRGLADFFVVNVSSPNTPNLRQLQDRAALEEILAALREAQENTPGPSRPILVKVAPDLSFEALDEVLDLALSVSLAGVVATNTTVGRPAHPTPGTERLYAETGGLSGRPLAQRSTEVIRHLYRQSRGALPIVGVGGIFSAEDAWEKITAGASLVQVYTGMVYRGPGIARAIVRGLRQRMATLGLKELREAVGLGTALA